MEKMKARLPLYADLITRSIDSCITHEQLNVCWDFISLFEMRFKEWIDSAELMMLVSQLQSHYFTKSKSFLC